MPPALRDWLPEGHLALFISDVVDTLDLEPILNVYEQGDGRGQPPYHPAMMIVIAAISLIINLQPYVCISLLLALAIAYIMIIVLLLHEGVDHAL